MAPNLRGGEWEAITGSSGATSGAAAEGGPGSGDPGGGDANGGAPGGAANSEQAPATRRRALVLTVSDGAAAGVRQDVSGAALARRLEELGLAVDRELVPDDVAQIGLLLSSAAANHDLIVTTGGTGLTPRDVTPQATRAVLEYEVPGLAELMRAEGGRSTPFAYLSRAVVGVLHRCLIVNVPGSPRGAVDSLAAIESVLDHALTTLAGPFNHDPGRERDMTQR